MKFADLENGARFRFTKKQGICIKQSNDSRFDNWGRYRFDPSIRNFFGGQDYLCPTDAEVTRIDDLTSCNA